jgi:hypothetical protein
LDELEPTTLVTVVSGNWYDVETAVDIVNGIKKLCPKLDVKVMVGSMRKVA